ncbi:GtrA family protein [Sphingobacterium spiritivorum]|uniref:GtrA family protein n=1 Tax=Sphingobacterium spiritivorum TaxID=258 RepID=UPI00191A2761|nr:GtrA family protein [Sphingobacterium spiritivorum]QQT26214.1 GtrA family protein [Sphingobacterium spiritivorum]
MYLIKRIHTTFKKNSILLLDKLHQSFFRFIPAKTFKYGFCGGSVSALNIFIYFISYNFILQKQIVQINNHIAVSPHIFAFIIAFAISFPIGFYLNMYVVFQEANRRKRIHLFRYFLVVLLCILLNYWLIKLFVEEFHIYPTPSAMLTTVIVTVVSYTLQKTFSFRGKKRLIAEHQY